MRMARNVYLLGFLSFFNDVSSDMVTPLLPVFVSGFGLGASFIGVMEGLANTLSHVTVLWAGWYSDRRGNLKKLTLFGYSLSAFVRLFLAIPIPAVTLLTRLTDRIGKGIRTAPRDRLITASVDRSKWGEAFGIQRAMDHGGALLGPPIAAWLLSAFSLNLSILFLIAALPAILALFFVPRKIRDVPIQLSGNKFKFSWKTLPRPLRRYVVLIFFAAMTTPSELFLLLKMQELGLAAYQVPLAWFFLTLCTLGASYLGGRLVKKMGVKKIIGTGWVLFALVYFAFAYNNNLHWAWLFMGLYGFHMGIVESSERSYPALVVSSHMRATALGLYYFSYGLGLLPASLLFGLCWDIWGSQTAFVMTGLLTLLITLFLPFLPNESLEGIREPLGEV